MLAAQQVLLSIHDRVAESGVIELRGKKVHLQLQLENDVIPADLIPKLRLEWKSYGYLWLDKMVTQPIKLTIPALPVVDDCREHRID